MASPSEGATASSAAPRTGSKKGGSGGLSHWDWSALPEPALFSISTFLTGSFADVLAFGRVCRAWESVARANERDLMSSLPPLLFRDRDADLYCPADGRSYKNRQLTALLGGEGHFQPIGCSFGHIIVTHFDANGANLGTFSVVNPLTATGTPASQFPPSFRAFVQWAALSSPPASPDCVLWSSDGYRMEFCRLGDQKWTAFSSQKRYDVWPPVFLRDKGYLNYEGKLAAFDVNPSSLELTILPVGDSSWSARCWDLRLCVSDAELLQIWLVRCERSARIQGFRVYRFDFAMADWVWLDNLGDRALFWDAFGATLSENPSRWGGCGNCIYFVDMEYDMLGVFHLKDGEIVCLARGSPTNPKFSSQSPVWIHPSLCY